MQPSYICLLPFSCPPKCCSRLLDIKELIWGGRPCWASYPFCVLKRISASGDTVLVLLFEFHGQRAGSDNWDDRCTLYYKWAGNKPEECVRTHQSVITRMQWGSHARCLSSLSVWVSNCGGFQKWFITKQPYCSLCKTEIAFFHHAVSMWI